MELIKLKRIGYMLRVSKKEAVSLILSLAHQIEDDDPNENCREYRAKGAPYFSISVNETTPAKGEGR
jgi:hypothetical protein